MHAATTTLSWLYDPLSVAVIGASARPGKLGYLLVDALVRGGYTGRVYPVNPAAPEICGLTSYASVGAIPHPVDLAAITLPAGQVLPAFEEAAAGGVRAVIIISSGFGETEAGRAAEETLARRARETGVRVIGPNCEGVIDFHTQFICSFGPNFVSEKRAGPVAMVSQSGGFTGIAYGLLTEAGLGFSRVMSSGNECDLAAIDFLADFAEEARTRLVLAYLEQIRRPEQFLAAMPAITREKPVVVVKGGRTDVGQEAARSHTGALAGSHRVVDAVLRQTGMVVARHMDEMADMAVGLSGRRQWMAGNRVGILSQSGGTAVEMADLCREAGFALPRLSPDTERELRTMIPHYGSVRNPIDFTAAIMSNPTWPGHCAGLLARDPELDAVLLVLTSARDMRVAEGLQQAAQAAEKPILVAWVGGRDSGIPVMQSLQAAGIPVLRSTNRAANALRALAAYGRYRLGGDFRGGGELDAAQRFRH